ncbi:MULTISPECIES: hypothetical protein [unclassified Phyllobacterium]|uniref:hypothetical protein n=1 Tax=unclassified Phyllobacterium TaxID=2638441 RepID=UPI003012C797
MIYNERIKLFATFLNSVGVAILAVGGLAPLITSLNGQTGPTLFISFMSAVSFLTAIALHSKPLPEEDETVTTLQMISFMIMPAAGCCSQVLSFYMTGDIRQSISIAAI